ncbi:MAG: Adenosylcobalamin/alpha-ribazole phosphatase [Eubacteriales bacterium SKADARSKE-1]|nr:Adenosylcobalamin/alpha-ribazole phosphatase [Eubacteriales bacterium SKADARSKE-1]
MKTYKIYLIRHGLTKENSIGKYIGSTDVPLSAEGKAKLEDFRTRFEYPKAGLVYTSPLSRCTQTADVLYPSLPKIISPGLSECNFGTWEGKTVDELKGNSEFIKWMTGENVELTNGGESIKDFTSRVSNTFEKIIDEIIRIYKKDVIIVTHGGVIMTILSKYGIPKANPYDWIANNGCGYSIRITPSLWMREQVFEVYEKIPAQKEDKLEEESMYIMDILKNSLKGS